MKKIFMTIVIVIIALLAVSLLVKKETNPSDNTRIILEHTYSTYIAPPCFNDANATNFLEESTLGTAVQMEYDAHDKCTETELAGEKESLFTSLLKDIGFIQKKWDKW